MTTAEPKAAPINALSFGAENIIFAESSDEKKKPLEMLARRGDPISHWFWGDIVHDFDGMLHRDKIAVDYNHDTSEPIGYVDGFEIRDGDLYLTGELTSIAQGDEADKMIRRSALGVPYQASIFFDDEQELILESVAEGFTAQVNGREIEGPAIIARQWRLRGVAVTPHGYDSGTESKFSRSSNGGDIPLNWKGASMPKNKLTAAKDEQVDEAVETGPDGAATPEDSATETTTETSTETADCADGSAAEESSELSATGKGDGLDKARQMLGLFADHFGQTDAAEYFAAGKNLTEAALSHVEKLSARVGELEAERDAAIQKLSAAQLGLGDQDGVDTGKPPSKDPKPTPESLFRQLGK